MKFFDALKKATKATTTKADDRAVVKLRATWNDLKFITNHKIAASCALIFFGGACASIGWVIGEKIFGG